jgi:hypothetical protein
LGEKEHWGKHVPWSECVRMPLIIVPPAGRRPAGFQPAARCQAAVSLLDLFPTLVDVCGLPPNDQLEGRSLLPLIQDTQSPWREAVVATIGRGTHSVFAGRWRYVRYFDGSEELYDLRDDPREWFNLAGNPDHSAVKRRLARHAPVDRRYVRFVRWGRWKCVFQADGTAMLFDYRGVFGISEQNDVAGENPGVVRAIRDYLDQHDITARRVNMPCPDKTAAVE